MLATCPISHIKVNDQVVRAISVFVTISAILFLLTSNNIFIYLLFVDFSLRLVRLNSYSPFFQLSLAILQKLKIKPKLSDEAPKRFSLYLGWGMSSIIALLVIFDLSTYAVWLVSVLFSCALLEMLFGFCVGCKIYQGLTTLKIL